jgi:DOPA 4,5-dioxygenase
LDEKPEQSTMEPADAACITSYHAHIYYKDAAERDAAALLREQIGARFSVRLGRWHDQLVGPHARPMYQVAFLPAQFAGFIPWLMLNRGDLAVLVHPNSGNPRGDHLKHPFWMGEVLPIMHPELLPQSDADEEPEDVSPNTLPQNSQ